MVKDNGGAIAQKGFHFQNHVISLVAIRNYKKKNFSIYVEADDDFEVLYDDDYHAYRQVKGQAKMSLAKLLNSHNAKPSIMEKNLKVGDDQSIYKIVVFEFATKDLKLMQFNNDELFGQSIKLSEFQKNDVEKALGNAISSKLDNFSIVKTNFPNDFKVARKYLKGELVDQKISVDNRDDVILDELYRLISQKSEFTLKSDEDKSFKQITSTELDSILWKISSKARFEEELSNFSFPTFREEKIKNEELKIIVQYMSEKKAIIKELSADISRLNEKNLFEILPDIEKSNCLSGLEANTKYAIIISAYCDILEGIVNE